VSARRWGQIRIAPIPSTGKYRIYDLHPTSANKAYQRNWKTTLTRHRASFPDFSICVQQLPPVVANMPSSAGPSTPARSPLTSPRGPKKHGAWSARPNVARRFTGRAPTLRVCWELLKDVTMESQSDCIPSSRSDKAGGGVHAFRKHSAPASRHRLVNWNNHLSS
jgi:hypothetical protein